MPLTHNSIIISIQDDLEIIYAYETADKDIKNFTYLFLSYPCKIK